MTYLNCFIEILNKSVLKQMNDPLLSAALHIASSQENLSN